MTEPELLKNEIKKKLSSYKAISAECRQLSEKLATLESLLGSPPCPDADGMPRASGVSNPVERRALRHMELEALYRAQLERLVAATTEIEEMIQGLPSMERQVLRLRYADGLSWEEVCDAVHYCWVQVHRIHNRALDILVAAEIERRNEKQ